MSIAKVERSIVRKYVKFECNNLGQGLGYELREEDFCRCSDIWWGNVLELTRILNFPGLENSQLRGPR